MNFFKKYFVLFKQTYMEWQDDDVSRLAAALAYYTIFSLAPLLLIAITIAGLIWSRSSVEVQVINQMQSLLGDEGAEFIRNLLQNASINMNQGIWATVVGIGVIVFGSIGVFRELRHAINTMWGIDVSEEKGFWNSIKSTLVENLLSFTMVLGVGFILLVSLTISTALTALNGLIEVYIKLPPLVTGLLNTIFTLAIITIVFTLLYKFIPETPVAWSDVFLGGFVTSVLFMVGKFAIGIYLGNSSVGTTFGAAGSLALLLIWVYYSAQILFFGAEFTQVYANQYGSKFGTINLKKNKKHKINSESQPSLKKQSFNSLEKNHTTTAIIPAALRETYPSHNNSDLKAYSSPDKFVLRSEDASKAAYMIVGLMVAAFFMGILSRLGLRGIRS